MNKNIKMVLFGIVAWLVPFVVAFFFYSKEGKLLIDVLLFKSIMAVVGAVTGAVLLILYFKKTEKSFLQEGVVVGLVWLALNWVFDLVVLVPMSGMGVGAYFTQIGVGYLAIPVMSILAGAVLEGKRKV